MNKPFRIISPDGIDINIEGGFDTWQEAIKFFNAWKNRYEQQGYYSSAKHGRIDLRDLPDFCEWIGFDNVPTVDYMTDEEKYLIDSVSTQ